MVFVSSAGDAGVFVVFVFAVCDVSAVDSGDVFHHRLFLLLEIVLLFFLLPYLFSFQF